MYTFGIISFNEKYDFDSLNFQVTMKLFAVCLILLCKTQNFIYLFHPYYAELCFQALNQISKERYKFDKKACRLCRNVSELLKF